MCKYAETRALLLRRMLGNEGIGGTVTIGRLRKLLGPLVEEERGTKPRWELLPDGRWRIVVPTRHDEAWAWAMPFIHEIGHGFTHQAGRSEEREEEDAERFRLCFIFPRRLLMAACRDSSEAVRELANSCPTDPCRLMEHYHWLQDHEPPDLATPEPWSAWQTFTIRREYSRAYDGLRVVSPTGQEWGWYCPSAEERERRRASLDILLRTFTPAEFTHVCRDNRLDQEPIALPRVLNTATIPPLAASLVVMALGAGG